MSRPQDIPPDNKTLGRPLKIFRGRTVSWNDFFLWVLPGVLIPLAFLAFGTFELISDYTGFTISPRGWFILAAVSLVPYGFLASRRFASARKSVLLCTHGIRLHNISRKHKNLLWCQISSLREGGTRYHFMGLPVSDSRFVAIEPFHGKEIYFPYSLDNLPALAERIKKQIYPLLLESMAVELSQGQRLDFGAVSLETESLLIRGKRIPANEVGALRVEAGRFVVESPQHGTIRTPIEKIANLELLLQVTRQQFTGS